MMWRALFASSYQHTNALALLKRAAHDAPKAVERRAVRLREKLGDHDVDRALRVAGFHGVDGAGAAVYGLTNVARLVIGCCLTQKSQM